VLILERNILLAELEQTEITPDMRKMILSLAVEIRDKISNPDFDTKRTILDNLDVTAQLQMGEEEPCVKIVCAISPYGAKIGLRSTKQMF
jgi:hypothetical protein